MALANVNPTIKMFKQALGQLDYSWEEFVLNNKAYTRFKSPAGGTWLTRDAQISYPFMDARNYVIAVNKPLAYELCAKNGVHTPKTFAFTDINDYRNELGGLMARGPVVVKPSNSSLSWGVTLNIRTRQDLEAAFDEAQKFSDIVIAQEQIWGQEVRFLVIEGQTRAALLRQTPQIVGDGKHTVQELLALENKDRQSLHDVLAQYPLLDEKILNFEALDLQAIPSSGEIIELSKSTMIRGGASMHNIIEHIDDSYKAIAEKAAHALSAQFIVVDLMINDINQPSNGTNYAFIEFNSAPVLALFYSCRSGPQYDVVAELVPMIDKVIKGRVV